MYKYVLISALTVSGLLCACDSKIDDLESKKESSNVAFTDSDGVVTATIDAAASSDQILVASPNSKVADASITVPPGALAVSTAISLGEASDQSSAILTELGVSTIGTPSTPVYVGPTSATPPNVAVPLTVKLPLPLGDLNTPNSLAATGTESKLVLLYVIYNNGWKSGVIPLTSDSFIGAFLKQAVQGFGYFQIVYLASAVAEKNGTSVLVPSLTDTTEDPVDETESKKITCTGDASGDLASHAYVKGCRLYKRSSSGSNQDCPYAINDVMNVGINGDGAISLINTNDEFSTGVLTAIPTAAADITTAKWALPNAQDAARSEVTITFEEVGAQKPIVSDGMKLEIYTAGSVSATCYFNYDSDL